MEVMHRQRMYYVVIKMRIKLNKESDFNPFLFAMVTTLF